jgi:hypothetical protein
MLNLQPGQHKQQHVIGWAHNTLTARALKLEQALSAQLGTAAQPAHLLKRHGVMPSSTLSQAPGLQLQDALARHQLVSWHSSQTPTA